MIDSGRRIGMAGSQRQVRKAPGLGARRALRRLDPQDVLLAVEGSLVENARILEEDGAAVAGLYGLDGTHPP